MSITRKLIIRLAAVALPGVAVIAVATPASALDNPPAPPASCTWGGTTYSSGAGKTTVSAGGWKHYTCTDGVWVLDSSCSGNCNPPPADMTVPVGGTKVKTAGLPVLAVAR